MKMQYRTFVRLKSTGLEVMTVLTDRLTSGSTIIHDRKEYLIDRVERDEYVREQTIWVGSR